MAISTTSIDMNLNSGAPNPVIAKSAIILGVPVELLSFKENEYLFRKGETPKGLYLIKSGCVKVVNDKTQSRGRIPTVGYVSKIAGPDDFLGLRALMNGTQHDSSVKTLRPTEVQIFPKEAVLQILNSSPSLFKVLLSYAVREIENNENSSQFDYLTSVQERIWHQLTLLADRFGIVKDDGVHLNLRLTRSELAQLAGTINESLSRHLTELKEQGAIDLIGKEIIIRKRV